MILCGNDKKHQGTYYHHFVDEVRECFLRTLNEPPHREAGSDPLRGEAVGR